MVSFWPWRSDPSSPASFEKTLSALSEKISKSQAHLDKLRVQSRRVRGLTTLYLMLAYLLYGIVALLVIGQQNMGPLEWTGLAGGPVVVYTTRQLVAVYFSYRIESTTHRLQSQQEERAKTIQKLKDATKYDTTLELLEKYGGEPKRDRQDDEDSGGLVSQQSLGPQGQQRQPGRTNLPPPPTANIQRRESMNRPATPNMMEPGAEFAPNADFSPARGQDQDTGPRYPGPAPPMEMKMPNRPSHPSPQFTQYDQRNGPQWYDRFLDLLLGEDEMAPRNRIALICGNCRLVNGQAPPGTKNLSEVGMWRCMGCGRMNGEVDEGRKILKELMEEKKKGSAKSGARPDEKAVEDDASEGSSGEVVEVPAPVEIVSPENDVEEESKARLKKRNKGKGGE